MKMPFSLSRYFFLALAVGSVSLTACKKDSEDSAATAGDGTMTWTHNGNTYTSTLYSSAIVDMGGKIILTGSSTDLNNAVSLALEGIDTKGAGVYDLRRGSVLDGLPAGVITLNGTGSQGTVFNTLYGPAASNGSITVTQYDKAGQKLSGTFTFTGGALPNTSASGTQNVTSGSFSFKKFR
jgi:hypothetical protein